MCPVCPQKILFLGGHVNIFYRLCEGHMNSRRVLRHDRGLSDERLRCGVILDTLDCHLGPSVVSHHHIWRGQRQVKFKHNIHGDPGLCYYGSDVWKLNDAEILVKTIPHLQTPLCQWSAGVSAPFCSRPSRLPREDKLHLTATDNRAISLMTLPSNHVDEIH